MSQVTAFWYVKGMDDTERYLEATTVNHNIKLSQANESIRYIETSHND